MGNVVEHIRTTVERLIQSPVHSIQKLPNIANNTVYKIDGERSYIFKLFRSDLTAI